MMYNLKKIESFCGLDDGLKNRQPQLLASAKSLAMRRHNSRTMLIPSLVFITAILWLDRFECLSSAYTAGANYSRPSSVMSPSSDRVYVIKSAATSHESTKDTLATFKQIFDKLTIHVKENTPIGSKLADIQADDRDSSRVEDNSRIFMNYAIVGGADAKSFNLTVDRYSGKVELINLVELDFESSKKNYHILIRALSLYLRYEVDIDLFVDDENDNKPQLDDFVIVFNNYKNHFPNLPVAKVPAFDADINDQSRLRYRVMAGNNAQLVVVNETTGDIQLSPWLDSNVPLKAVITVAVSDGIHEDVADMVLKVNLITETMLQNSVVLRLDGIGREEFLSKKYDIFLAQMVRMLGPNNLYGTNNIVVLNVEESMVETMQHESLTYRTHAGSSIDNLTLSVNVSFAARAEAGNELESYLNRHYIEERIYLNREQLSQALDVFIPFPNSENPCAQSSACQEYQECHAIHKFDSAPKTFVLTKSIMFRPIKAVQSFLCSCRPNSADTGAGNSSVCGPCNCDVSKGYSGDCDRDTNQCYCKANHFRPLGSDFCLPCDCYDDGSLDATCNQTLTGQCKCRPGVVGRRCDTCSSPYAEVTLRGCDVIYDACPKTYSDGIWWNRTPLDRPATQQCPQATSTGTATRFCHKTDGWLKANLFDCISNTFTNLYNQYQVLEERKFPLTLETAIKIASDLRVALNETITNPALQLYGSDMYIGFRLIHHLIQYESQQTGLNLTHRQDRLYVRNIAESVNNLLDPKYAHNWPEIAARSPNGGAEYLLKLMDTYGRVLIESQSDTFTQPFEISRKYFTFGMDTLSSEQLWDLNRAPSNNFISNQPPYATPDSFNSSSSSSSSTISIEGITGSGTGADIMLDNSRHQFNSDGSSVYLEHSLKGDSSPAIIIPKYDNYPADSTDLPDGITKVLLPLKTVRIKTIEELLMQANNLTGFARQSRAKRDDLLAAEMRFIRQQQQQQPALVVYSIYRSLGPLLPHNLDNSVQNRLGATASPNSPVVWLTVRPANSSEFLYKSIQPKITYMLKVNQPDGMMRPQCAVWDFNPQLTGIATLKSSGGGGGGGGSNQTAATVVYGIKQTGRFSTKGCEIRGIHPSNNRLRFKYDYINCSCDHLGAVTVLMDTANYDSLTAEETNMKDITLCFAFCASLLIMGSIYFVLSFVRGHSIKSNSNSINKNLIFVLILIELLILYTIYSKSSLNQHEYQCKLVAIFLHYLSISLFFWLLVNAIHFYRMLTELRDINHGPMKFYHIIGYAIPAFFVSIAVGLRIEQFGSYLFCWLSVHEPIIWSMFGPISVVAACTCLAIVLAFFKTLPIESSVEDPANGTDLLKNHMLINIIKTPLIGLYWLFTVFAVNQSISTEAFYLFPAIVCLKSVLLFFLLCIVDKHIRYNLYVSWLRLRGEKAPFLEDTVNYSSNQWMPNQTIIGHHQLGKHGQHSYVGYGANMASGIGVGLMGQPHTPGFQSSCTDIFKPDVLAFSAASTTSRSSVTGSSSAVAYQYQQHRHRGDDGYARAGARSGGTSKHRRRHKKHKHHHHRHHHHHHHHRSRHTHNNNDNYDDHYEDHQRPSYEATNHSQAANTNDDSNSLNELASSHSSDDDLSIMPKRELQSNASQKPPEGRRSPPANEPENNQLLSAGSKLDSKQQTVPMQLSGPSRGGGGLNSQSPPNCITDDLQAESSAQSIA